MSDQILNNGRPSRRLDPSDPIAVQRSKEWRETMLMWERDELIRVLRCRVSEGVRENKRLHKRIDQLAESLEEHIKKTQPLVVCVNISK